MRIGHIFLASLLSTALAFGRRKSYNSKIRSHFKQMASKVSAGAAAPTDFFEGWDTNDLRDWLKAHGDTSNYGLRDLKEAANKHMDWLSDDVKKYVEQSKGNVNNFLQKSVDYFKDTSSNSWDNMIKGWSDSRLRDFLDARGVSAPLEAGRDKLMELYEHAKNKAVTSSSETPQRYWFDSWSSQDLKESLKELGLNVDGTRKELASRLYDAVIEEFNSGRHVGQGLGDNLQDTYEDVKAQIQDNVEEGKDRLHGGFRDAKSSVKDAVRHGKEHVDKGKEKLQDHYKEGKAQGQKIGDNLKASYEEGKAKGWRFGQKIQSHISSGKGKVEDQYNEGKSKGKQFMKKMQDQYEDGKSKGEAFGHKIQKNYEDGVAKGQHAGQKVSENVGRAANDLARKWNRFKEGTFEKWSVEDLKDYLSDFGEPVASTKDDLVKAAQNHWNHIVGATKPSTTSKLSYRFKVFFGRFIPSFVRTKKTKDSFSYKVGNFLGQLFRFPRLDL